MQFTKDQTFHDIVIVGAGGAGQMAALEAARNGLSVALVSKVHPKLSHTAAAAGGINAAIGASTPDDWRWHMYDTIKGSDWLADQDAVEFMCMNAKAAIDDLVELGVPFSRDEEGRLYQRQYGGQSTDFGKGPRAHRALAAADRTGAAILETLYDKAKQLDINFFNEYFLLDLAYSDEGEVTAAICLNLATGAFHIFGGRYFIIATGGYSQIYGTNTSSSICTGDGTAVLARNGFAMKDMEFVQFHPTGLYGSGILITEAARGEGAYLYNNKGERFMQKYAPNFMELASRDIIARAISEEIALGGGVGPKADHVLLSLRHLDPIMIDERLPMLKEIASKFAGLDATKQDLPIAPSAHYTMGGVATDINGLVANNLYAIGEAACISVHGAGRLGCNSLLELFVFAKAAIRHIKSCSGDRSPSQETVNIDSTLSKINDILTKSGSEDLHNIRDSLGLTMSLHVGVFRHENSLTQAENSIKIYKEQLRNVTLADKGLIYNNELQKYIELENLLILAEMTVMAALSRKESRGAHFRQDFAKRDDANWLHHQLIRLENNSFKIIKQDVNFKPIYSQSLKPEERKY